MEGIVIPIEHTRMQLKQVVERWFMEIWKWENDIG